MTPAVRVMARTEGSVAFRKMGFPVHDIPMEFGLKSLLDLRRGSVHRQPITAASNPGDGQALRLEPGSDCGKIAIACAESSGELLRRQPMMIFRRRRDLLRGQQRLERGLLLGRACQLQRYVCERERGRHSALVVLGARSRGDVSSHRKTPLIVNAFGDAARLRWRADRQQADRGT